MDVNKRKELEEKLNVKLNTLAVNKKIQEAIKTYYSNKNISPAVGIRLLTKNAPIEVLKDVELCVFTTIIYKTLLKGEEKDQQIAQDIDPKKYFTDREIELEELYKLEKQEVSNVVIFNKVDQKKEDHWISTEFTFAEIAYLSRNGLVRYNPNTQREATIKFVGDDIAKIPTLNSTNLTEIYNSIMNDEFTSNTISYNILKTGRENAPIYNPNDRTLTVYLDENTTLDIIDGYHRQVAATSIMSKNPRFNFDFNLNIFNRDEEGANRFIEQENKGTKIKAELLEEKNTSDFNALLAKEIGTSGNTRINEMFSKTTTYIEEIEANRKYCTFKTLQYSIKYFFLQEDIKDRNTSQLIKDTIIRGYNKIIRMNSAKFDIKVLPTTKKNSVIALNNIFSFYMAIISKLYYNGYGDTIGVFEKKLESILNEIDFSIDNPLWIELAIIESDGQSWKELIARQYKAIQKYVNVLLKDLEVISTDNEVDVEATL